MIAKCQIVSLPKISDPRGNLTYIEGSLHIPFNIRRVFYLYDVPGGADRGGHALKSCWQFLIAMSGSFDVVVDEMSAKKRFHLNRSHFGLLLPPMVWREMDNFSSGAVCLVLASERYSESDYFRRYEDFVKAVVER
jgi:hypothetical protein